MKITASSKECPKCKSSSMVMGAKTGKVHFFGCLKCKNAQGLHLSAKDAKQAWKDYCANFPQLKETKND